MKRSETTRICGVPAIVYGDECDSAYLFIHGKCGCKEEAEDFADIVCGRGWQVLSIDLPGHGERKDVTDSFDPWHVIPELKAVMQYARQRWAKIALRANSIGAWFSMLSFQDEPLEKCLFVSPLLDMEKLIRNMMRYAEVSEARLEKEQTIAASFGETLSWRYLEFAKRNPITRWTPPTAILYAGHDDLTDRATVEGFAKRFNCSLSIMEDGEHWFHTEEQLKALHKWTEQEG